MNSPVLLQDSLQMVHILRTTPGYRSLHVSYIFISSMCIYLVHIYVNIYRAKYLIPYRFSHVANLSKSY
jgi:hypothetical protein